MHIQRLTHAPVSTTTMRWILLIALLAFDASSSAWAKLTCEHVYNACINRCLRVPADSKPACIQSCNAKNKACEAPLNRKNRG